MERGSSGAHAGGQLFRPVMPGSNRVARTGIPFRSHTHPPRAAFLHGRRARQSNRLNRRPNAASPVDPLVPRGFGPFISANRLLPASAPVEVELVLDLDGGIVVGDLARGLAGPVGGAEDDAVVDVEDSGATAGRPDVAGSGDLVLLGVDAALGPDTAADDRGRGGRGGRSVLAEEICAGELAGNALVELCPAVVDAAEDGELVTTGVLEVQVQLAVLVAVGAGVGGADVGLEAIEAEGDDLI
jgi:hypothetical protein